MADTKVIGACWEDAEWVLYRAIRELAYCHIVEDLSLVKTSDGAAVIADGMKLLGVTDLEATAEELRWPEPMKEFDCEACGRKFWATPEDVETAGGHLCLWAEKGLTQREAIEELKKSNRG